MANIRIRAKHNALTQLVRPRPDVDERFVRFVSSEDGFSVCIERNVLDFIALQAKRAGSDETIGLLCGRICHDPKSGDYTLIMAAENALDGEFQSTTGDVKLLASGHAKLRYRLEYAHPDREIVGWYHTHPHHQPRFSDVDMGEQATWSDPNHIGIVYSGLNTSEPFGVYRGPQAILLRRMHNEQMFDEADVKTKFESNFLPHSPMQPSHNLTPRREPNVRIPGHHKSDESTPPHSRHRKLKWLVFTALTFVIVGQAADLIWIHRRVSVAEKRLDELAGRGAKEHVGEKGAAQVQSNPALTPTATPSQRDTTILFESAVPDEPDRPRAKPSTPTTRIVQQSQRGKSPVSPSNKPSKDRDRQSRSENKYAGTNTQRAEGKSVETTPSPKVVAPELGHQP